MTNNGEKTSNTILVNRAAVKETKKYRVGGSVHDTYKYEVFGFSLYYLTKK